MRSSWKGAITFGLVSIPVQLFPATEEHGVHLHQVHEKDGGRIRLKRYCELEEREVPYKEIAKAYESPDGRQAVLTDEDMAELPLPSKKIIDVLAFVDVDEIDPLMLSKAYYLQTATPSAAKPYVLLREALVKSGKSAVTKITLRTRESLALLRVHDDILILQTMLWPDEVRAPKGLAPEGKFDIRPQELKMATSLMDTLSEDFDFHTLHDDYKVALDSLVAARLDGSAPAESDEGDDSKAPDNVVDLMAALTASVKAAKKPGAGKSSARGETGEAGAGSGKKTASKTAAKKSAAKKSSAGKSTAAKKTAEGKPARKRTSA
ncbi:Ku protein [Streptomyces sp. SID3343]|uniref:non-homologous end joining protein Ku n=1 Tax=Streptomyces sp. SID3343 TaxID=2690260 RepID=UPI0013687ACE|nr:Ku protein [Streptomyces sp. SID3343]MYW05014.1 Ku protein [Streptomyces sp. SID3343]